MVNLAGTFSSIVQGITASKAPFARTPKVKDRTVVPPFLLVAPYLLIGLAGFTFYHAYVHHLTENAAYAALRSDPKAWKAEQAERALWDKTLADGLKDE